MTQSLTHVKASASSHVEATLIYRYDDSGESGREWVTLTSDQEGTRTVRALSELDDVGLRRDATITYGPDLRAQNGYIHMIQHGAFLGAGWFRFGADFVALEAETAAEGRVSQRMDFDEPLGVFAPHPVFLDGWHAWFHNPNGPAVQNLRNCITSSPLWHGASGPMICLNTGALRGCRTPRLRFRLELLPVNLTGSFPPSQTGRQSHSGSMGHTRSSSNCAGITSKQHTN